MEFRNTIAFVVAICTLGVGLSASAQTPSVGDLRKSGTVRLEISCSSEVKEDFQHALALLHSFFYEEARRRFLDIAQRDPDCAMAWWGVAMTWYHPIWTPPNPVEMSQGLEAVNKAKALGGKTELERGFIDAIDAYYRTEDEPSEGTEAVAVSCHGPRAHSARADAFREVFVELQKKYPNNLEVNVFHALSLMGTAVPTDKTYKNYLLAAAILEPLFETNPDHPGIAHYIIHAYDFPSLAQRGLKAAKTYDSIAPWVPHALHMPTHIYTRLGMWQESIEGNIASSTAARDYSANYCDGATLMDDLHALDYLAYAYLQTEQDSNARQVISDIQKITKIHPGNEFASAYALCAIPARYVLERRQWNEAATLPMPLPEFVKPYPFAVAHIEFARAVGAARSGDPDTAAIAVAHLQALRDQLTDPKFQWWITQVDIQRTAASGWLAAAREDYSEAERLLRECAEMEDKAGIHPVTPGQILPVREQLADLLMELNRPEEALREYAKSLETAVHRFNSHFGAARAAELIGKREVAIEHYRALIEMTAPGDGKRKELAMARAYLESN